MIAKLLLAQLLYTTAQAVAWQGPQQTLRAISTLDTPIPQPTDPPTLLNRRAVLDSSVCGYLSGRKDLVSGTTCPSNAKCTHDAAHSWWGCCTGNSCEKYTRCVDLAAASAHKCGSTCISSSMTLGCTKAAQPYCAASVLYLLEGGFALWRFGCAASPATSTFFEEMNGVVITSTAKVSGAGFPDPLFNPQDLSAGSAVGALTSLKGGQPAMATARNTGFGVVPTQVSGAPAKAVFGVKGILALVLGACWMSLG